MWSEIKQAQDENKREINLSGAEISERITANGLDSAVFSLQSLNLLNISETVLEVLPVELSNLCNLQTLLLYDNQIKSVPDAIGLLDKLKVLDLSRNQIEELPESIKNLQNLTTINVSHNRLTTIPALTNSPKLSVVNGSNNQLAAFPNICTENNKSLSEIYLMDNAIGCIPHTIEQLTSLKHLSLIRNQVKTIPKSLANISKLKDLEMVENPIADKRLLKLIQQCRTKQILDYVKKNGADYVASTNNEKSDANETPSKSSKPKPAETNAHKIFVKSANDDLTIIYDSSVKEIRPFILCCVVDNVDLSNNSYRRFIQLQTKLHDAVCGKREKSTIATHDYNKIVLTDQRIRYTSAAPNRLQIHALGKSKKLTALELYEGLKRDAEAVRKEKKRNVYSGIHKYLYLLENKERFAYLEDGGANVISLPPLTNSEATKITPDTKKLLIEVTSSTTMVDCRTTIEQLLKSMLLAGLGRKADNSEQYLLDVTQIRITDADGNLRTVYPSKTDLVCEKSENISIERN